MRRVLQPVKASNIDSPDMIFAAPRENICKAKKCPFPTGEGISFFDVRKSELFPASAPPLDRMLRDRSTFPSFAKQEEGLFLIQCSFNDKYLMPGSLHRCPESRFLKRLVRKNPAFPFAWEETTFFTAMVFHIVSFMGASHLLQTIPSISRVVFIILYPFRQAFMPLRFVCALKISAI